MNHISSLENWGVDKMDYAKAKHSDALRPNDDNSTGKYIYVIQLLACLPLLLILAGILIILSPDTSVFTLLLSTVLAELVIVVWFCKKELYLKSPTWKQGAGAVCLGILLFFILQVLSLLIEALGISLHNSHTTNILANQSTIPKYICLFLLAPVVVPFAEELFFRTMVCSRVWLATNHSIFGRILAVFISSLMFSAMHFENFSAMGILIVGWTAIMGAVNAILFDRCKTVWIPFLVHASYNLTTTLSLLVAFS